MMPEKPAEEFVEKFVKEGAEKVTDKDVEKVVSKSEEIQEKFNTKGPLKRFIDDGKLLLAFVKDYWAGNYRKIPFGVIGAIVFSLIYVFNPFDLVPDMIPFIGQVDDVGVISACLLLVERDLHKYRDWKQGQG